MATRRKFMGQMSLLGAAPLTILRSGTAVAQDGASWPERPVKIIVGFAPGGGNDVTARLLARGMATALGQSVIVDNRAGAGGVVGTQAVAQARPDGYTLMLGTSSQLVTNVALYSKLTFSIQNSLASVALISRTPYSLLCNASLPVRTLGEFIAFAKARSGKMNFGTAGAGSGTHVAAEKFLRASGLRIPTVHYRGQAGAYQGLLGGEVDVLMDGTPKAAAELVTGGKARALAVSLRKSTALPGVPTFREAGLEEADSYTWNSIMAPAGTPPAILHKLNTAVNQAISTPAVQDYFIKGGIDSLGGSDVSATETYWREELARWVPIVKEMKISLD